MVISNLCLVHEASKYLFPNKDEVKMARTEQIFFFFSVFYTLTPFQSIKMQKERKENQTSFVTLQSSLTKDGMKQLYF